MDTSTYNMITVVLWAFTLLAGLATVCVYYRQLQVMDASLKAQNLAWLVQYMQAPDVRHARFVVMTELETKDFVDWSLSEQEEAATACAAYGVAGVYIELKRVDKDIIIRNWGPSIEKVCSICEDFIEDRRGKSGQRYWNALIWLNKEVKKAMAQA